MPLLQLDIASLMADLLHKRADLTVVNVSQRRPDAWAVGGQALPPVMTLRQMAGMPCAQTPPPAHTALLLIDFQREYVDGALPLPDGAHAARQASQLVAAAERVGVPVIHVHHEAASALAPAFAPGSPGAQPMHELPVASGHHRIVKQWPSSFKGTPLHAHLQDLKVQHLLVAGLMTHNCVDSTARDALHLGYAVTVIRDACATRDLPDGQGGVVPASQVHEVSLAALTDRHADVVNASEVVRAWRV